MLRRSADQVLSALHSSVRFSAAEKKQTNLFLHPLPRQVSGYHHSCEWNNLSFGFWSDSLSVPVESWAVSCCAPPAWWAAPVPPAAPPASAAAAPRCPSWLRYPPAAAERRLPAEKTWCPPSFVHFRGKVKIWIWLQICNSVSMWLDFAHRFFRSLVVPLC